MYRFTCLSLTCKRSGGVLFSCVMSTWFLPLVGSPCPSADCPSSKSAGVRWSLLRFPPRPSKNCYFRFKSRYFYWLLLVLWFTMTLTVTISIRWTVFRVIATGFFSLYYPLPDMLFHLATVHDQIVIFSGTEIVIYTLRSIFCRGSFNVARIFFIFYSLWMFWIRNEGTHLIGVGLKFKIKLTWPRSWRKWCSVLQRFSNYIQPYRTSASMYNPHFYSLPYSSASSFVLC